MRKRLKNKEVRGDYLGDAVYDTVKKQLPLYRKLTVWCTQHCALTLMGPCEVVYLVEN